MSLLLLFRKRSTGVVDEIDTPASRTLLLAMGVRRLLVTGVFVPSRIARQTGGYMGDALTSGELEVKDPNEVKDYSLNWVYELGADVIASSAWAVESGDVVIDTSDRSGTATRVWLSGGTAGAHVLKNTVITNSSPARTLIRHITITVGLNSV